MRIKRDKTLVRGLFALNVFDVSKRKSAKIRFDFQKRLLDVDDVSTEIDWFLPSVHLGWWWRERVLWQFVKLMREKYPTARVVIYTGDNVMMGRGRKS